MSGLPDEAIKRLFSRIGLLMEERSPLEIDPAVADAFGPVHATTLASLDRWKRDDASGVIDRRARVRRIREVARVCLFSAATAIVVVLALEWLRS